MARNWTPSQGKAIAERNRTLLISAAAGSGKTATLTERIIRSLIDPANPADLSRMLIVTFTRSAAAELRSRISGALSAAIAAGGKTPHLSRQLLALPTAKISTIDSFCLELVRAHAVRLGLSPSFRLADVAEDKLLKTSLMRRFIEDCCDGQCEGVDEREFYALYDALEGSGEGMGEVLLSLYEKVEGYARSHRVLDDITVLFRDAATKEPFETPWGEYIRGATEQTLAPYASLFADLLSRIRDDGSLPPKISEVLDADCAFLTRVRHALTLGYTEARAALLSPDKQSFKGGIPRGFAHPLYDEAKALHAKPYGALEKLLEKWYAYTGEQWEELLLTLAGKTALLAHLLSLFSARVAEEKRRRSILSFSDLSRYAYLLLCAEDGGKTPLAEELCRDFDYVYVDEYQDVNEVQHRIFEALSRSRGRFMVGDIKQSIYAFRGAQPEIFAALRRAFPNLDAAGDSDFATLSFSENFRSTREILAFVNLVFGRHMATGLGENIGYRADEDCLRSEKKPEDGEGPRVTVALFLSPTKEKKGAAPATDEDATAADALAAGQDTPTAEEVAKEAQAQELSLSEREASYVADEIARLLREGTKKADGSLLLPSDIAILLRTSHEAEHFAAALAARGLKSECPTNKGFFLSAEVLLALSLLNVIDNPRRDVYLAGLLRSPLYGFTMDDLIAIRTEAAGDERLKGATLYEHLLAYADAHPEKGSVSRFLSDLDRYRRMAEARPVDELIWQLYRETGLLSIAGAEKAGDPVARRENLILLYDYARRFEGSSYRGLYNFIAYINEAIDRGQSIEEVREKSDHPDTVRIMTVHGSKGLEFPVCFVSDCGRNLPEGKERRLIFDRHLGLSLKLRDEDTLASYNNPIFSAIEAGQKQQEVEQLLRLLYVALTRPRERLYVTGTATATALAAYASAVANGLKKETTYTATSFLKLLVTALWEDDSYDLLINGTPFTPTPSADAAALEERLNAAIAAEGKTAPATGATPEAEDTDPVPDAPMLDEERVAAYAETLTERFSYDYPDRHLSRLPGKLSVSHLYPAVLDGTDGENALPAPDADTPLVDLSTLLEEESPVSPTVPLFLGGEVNTAARAGTATHLFMQFCDFATLAETDVDTELSRLVDRQFLSEEDAALVRRDEILRFTRSSLFAALAEKGSRLYRELRFHVRFPAAAFTQSEQARARFAGESLLVQGVMDAVYISPSGQMWLIDYKTDRLTREEARDRQKAEDKLRSRHALQLSYYAAACRDIFGRLPDRVMIYSLALGDTVELPVALPEGMSSENNGKDQG